MNVDKIDYWVKKYGYTSIGKLVDVKSKVTPIRGASTSLIHQWFKPLPPSPCNYIIVIDSQIYKGKFGRTKNLKQRFRCYGSRGGKRVQDRIHNALFDEMLNAFNNGKNVEFYVRPAEKIGEKIINGKLYESYLDVESLEKDNANEYKTIMGKWPLYYNPK